MELDRRSTTADEDSDDWEEVDEFDPAHSVFGSEAVHQKKRRGLLGKRSRQKYESESVSDDSSMGSVDDSVELHNGGSSDSSKIFLTSSRNAAKQLSLGNRKPLTRNHASIYMPMRVPALYG